MKGPIAPKGCALLGRNALGVRSDHALIEDVLVSLSEVGVAHDRSHGRRSDQIRAGWLFQYPRTAEQGLYEEDDGKELKGKTFLVAPRLSLLLTPLPRVRGPWRARRRCEQHVNREDQEAPEHHQLMVPMSQVDAPSVVQGRQVGDLLFPRQ